MCWQAGYESEGSEGEEEQDLQKTEWMGFNPPYSEAVEYDTVIPPKGVFERTGLVLGASTGAKYVTAYASTANVNVNIYGIETATS